jgi:hypothetical protein
VPPADVRRGLGGTKFAGGWPEIEAKEESCAKAAGAKHYWVLLLSKNVFTRENGRNGLVMLFFKVGFIDFCKRLMRKNEDLAFLRFQYEAFGDFGPVTMVK